MSIYSSGPNYDLKIEHVRWGSFTPTTSESSVNFNEVIYIQTAIDLATPEHRQLLDELVPVREFIGQEMLGFENLMQRDLDDHRVSNRLIPYLLNQNPLHFRMFPSILVLLAPSQNKQLTDLYLPKLDDCIEPFENGLEYVTTRFGDGDISDAFAFKKLKRVDGSDLPYGASLLVNKQFSRFVIIDGQHRAMALLAIFRNLTAWPNEGKPFRHFYKNYPKKVLENVDLKNLSLPVTICFFPQLNSGNQQVKENGFKVVNAARKVFLDVNRTAKAPSKARQVLLDDVHITSDFVRVIMTQFKDSPVKNGLKIWNLFYDQIEDQQSALPKGAVTSVLHIEFMIRMLLLSRKPRTGDPLSIRCDFGQYNPSQQTNAKTMVEMLSLRENFGSDAGHWKNNNIPLEKRIKVKEHFLNSWGKVIVDFLNFFPPYQSISVSTQEYYDHVNQSDVEGDEIMRRVLYEGQGVRNVLESIGESFQRDNKEDEEREIIFEYPETAVTTINRQISRIKYWEDQIVKRASEHFWTSGKKWPQSLSSETKDKFISAFQNSLLAKILKTKAFQVGMIMAIAHMERKLSSVAREKFWEFYIPEVLLDTVNCYFSVDPETIPGERSQEKKVESWAKELLEKDPIATFTSSPDGIYSHLRSVFSGELNDGKWTLLKYCIFEIWYSKNKRVLDAWKKWELKDSNTKEIISLIKGFLADALPVYRNRIINREVKNEKERYRRENGEPPTDEISKQIEGNALKHLKNAIEFSCSYVPEISESKDDDSEEADDFLDNGE